MNAHSAYASSTGIVTLRPIVTHGTAGRPVTNSRDVARYFGKPHNDVLKSIRALLSQAPAAEGNFSRSEYRDPTGRSLPCFDMDRDGFTLLAMGFTGPKALQFKMAYIAEFNAMEAELEAQASKPQFVIPQTLPEALRLAAEQAERAIAEPKAEALDAISTADGYFNLGSAAKNLGIPPRAGFISTLLKLGVLFRSAGRTVVRP